MQLGRLATLRICGLLAALTFAASGIQPVSAQIQGAWTGTGTMQSARESNVQLRLADGKVMSVGGVDGGGNLLAAAELYDPASGTWSATGSMATAREAFAAVLLGNGKVLVSGGYAAGGTVTAAVEIYDPATGAWAAAGPLGLARYGHTATLLTNGKVLVAGGCTAASCATDTGASELYDPASNSWSVTGSLATARAFHSAVRLGGGMVIAIGGYAGGASSAVEIYDPAKGVWAAGPSTNVARYLNSTTLLPSGKVLVAGGVITKYPLNSAELYDPVAKSWSITGAMTVGRYAHAAVALPDGTVMLAGGFGQSISCGKACTGYVPTGRTELYDEALGSFTAAATLGQPQAYQSATELASGGALFAGGIGTTATCCIVLATAQIYTPLSLTFSATALNFGLLQLGLTSPAQTLTISNVSMHTVRFGGVALSGDYLATDHCPVVLQPGQSCSGSISFRPKAAGPRNGAVTIRDNSPGSPVQTIALSGMGETLALGFDPGSLNLGSVAVGSSIAQSATLTNDGAAPVAISTIAVAPSNGTFTQTNNCPATLTVQQSCAVTVVFTPPDVFTYTATVSVTNGAGAAATLKLTGTGLDGP